MALTTYYMLCDAEDTICGFKNLSFGDVQGFTERSATFSLDSGDSPDVLLNSPSLKDSFTAGGTYTQHDASRPCLKLTWSGDGSLVGDIYEMVANGSNSASLSIQLWDEATDSAINTGSQLYWVQVNGTSVRPGDGRVALDGAGAGSVVFIPSVIDLGLSYITLTPVDPTSPCQKTTSKLGTI